MAQEGTQCAHQSSAGAATERAGQHLCQQRVFKKSMRLLLPVLSVHKVGWCLLLASAPEYSSPLQFHSPVYGAIKASVLASARTGQHLDAVVQGADRLVHIFLLTNMHCAPEPALEEVRAGQVVEGQHTAPHNRTSRTACHGTVSE